MAIRNHFFILYIFVLNICFSQKSKGYFDEVRTFEFNKIKIEKLSDSNPRSFFIKQQFSYLTQGKILKPLKYNFELDSLSIEDRTFHLLALGDYHISNIEKNSDSLAISSYLKALEIAEKVNDSILLCEVFKRILIYQFKNQRDIPAFVYFAEKYKRFAYDEHEKLYANYFYMGSILGRIYHLKDYSQDPIPIGKKYLQIARNSNNDFFTGRFSQLLGVHYDLILKETKTGKIFYQSALNSYNKIAYEYGKKHVKDILYNLGTIEEENGNYKKALFYLNQIDKTSIENRDYKDLILIYDYLYKTYKKENLLDSSLYFLEKKNNLNDSLKLIERANAVSEIITKYQTLEKEKQILTLENNNLLNEAKAQNNRNLFLGSIIVLGIGIIIGVLTYKNTKRKQRIAEQEREIQIQKTEKILKEQELASIDAMLAGQEKERQRLANDLHDSLGGTLATVKLHFEHLKNNRDNPKADNVEELYAKTDNLLNEAYQKVRTIAHEKNSGVMANQGLLPAIKNLAKKVSYGNHLTIDIQDYGLEQRLDNHIEITIFRIIQELITNIIKHANATEIQISLTNHDAMLNIIVEDNGKGFDAKKLPQKEGMGLATIEKRIEHLEGSFEIDATPGKGTNIIINIPI